MKPKTLKEIRVTENHYEDLRWSADFDWQRADLDELENIRRDLSETIGILSGWHNRRLTEKNHAYVYRVKQKLIDFQWKVNDEIQSKVQRETLRTRLLKAFNPEPRQEKQLTTDYGLTAPLKGSLFFKELRKQFPPRSKRSVQSHA